jgi:Fe-S cluster biosynthesis and repair protein YggX
MELSEKQELFLDLLEKSLGVVSLALQKSEISKEDYDNWMKNQTFKKRVDNINELSIDFVENKLLKKIQNDDLNAIQFYLKTKGKKRGY